MESIQWHHPAREQNQQVRVPSQWPYLNMEPSQLAHPSTELIQKHSLLTLEYSSSLIQPETLLRRPACPQTLAIPQTELTGEDFFPPRANL